MKNVIVGLLVAFWLCGAVWAQAEKAPVLAAEQMEQEKSFYEINQQVALLDQEVEDLQARYWAWRVVHEKNTTLEELKQYSEHWIGDGARSYQLIEEAVRKGNVVKLTPEEHRRLDEHRKKARSLLNPEASNMELIATLTQSECAELDARHGAYRAQTDPEKWYKPGWEDIFLEPESYYTETGDLVVNLPRNIKRGKKARKLFLKYLKDKNIQPLSPQEERRLNACAYFDEQVLSITRYPSYRYTGE